MRHGKSSWDDPSLPDHERPLASRGQRNVVAIAKALKRRGWWPDQVLLSDACRTVETVSLLESTLPGLATQRAPELYLGGVHQLAQALRHCTSTIQKILVVGHNPGLESCITYLTGVQVTLKTSDLAFLKPFDQDLSDWRLSTKQPGQYQLLETVAGRALSQLR